MFHELSTHNPSTISIHVHHHFLARKYAHVDDNFAIYTSLSQLLVNVGNDQKVTE